jgi:hypothetical protein
MLLPYFKVFPLIKQAIPFSDLPRYRTTHRRFSPGRSQEAPPHGRVRRPQSRHPKRLRLLLPRQRFIFFFFSLRQRRISPPKMGRRFNFSCDPIIVFIYTCTFRNANSTTRQGQPERRSEKDPGDPAVFLLLAARTQMQCVS